MKGTLNQKNTLNLLGGGSKVKWCVSFLYGQLGIQESLKASRMASGCKATSNKLKDSKEPYIHSQLYGPDRAKQNQI